MEQTALQLFLLSIGASFVQRTTGFGFGIFIMTMLPTLMPSYGEATTLSGKSLQWILYICCGHGLCVWYSRSAYRQSNGDLGFPPYYRQLIEIHYLHVYRHQRPNISVG